MTEDEAQEAAEIAAIPEAAKVMVWFCGHCNNPHVVLYNKEGKPYAQFVVGPTNPFVRKFADAIKRAEMN